MKIEKIKKNNKEKYEVILNNGTVLELYEDVIIKYNLLYKKEINLELINEIENYNLYQDVYNMSVKYILTRLRSKSEIRIYLKKKNISLEIIENVVINLEKNNLLNDEIFAKAFIKDKINFTTMGKYKIINELKILKIEESIIDNAICEIAEEIWIEKIEKLITKYLKSNKKNIGNDLKNKLYIYLVNLGHDKSLVINSLNNYNF